MSDVILHSIFFFSIGMCSCPHSPSLYIHMCPWKQHTWSATNSMSKHQKWRFLCNHHFIQNHTDQLNLEGERNLWKSSSPIYLLKVGTGKAGHSRTCPVEDSVCPRIETQPPLCAKCYCIQPHSQYRVSFFFTASVVFLPYPSICF